MGCFLGCFGDTKEHKRRPQKISRSSPQHQRNRVENVERNRVENVEQEIAITGEQLVRETTTPTDLVPVLRNISEGVKQLSVSPKKRVTFNSNITTYEHIESDDILLESSEEKQEDSKNSHSHLLCEDNDDHSVTSSVGSYPPNHRYHNSRESDDEIEEYCDSELDDVEEDDYSDEDIDAWISSHEVWSESMESRTGNTSPPAIIQEVESPLMKTQPYEDVQVFGPKPSVSRDRSGYVNSVLNPVENITQWKAAKSKGTHHLKPLQKENFDRLEAPKSHQTKNANREIAVDTSLSNWLVSPDITPSKITTGSRE